MQEDERLNAVRAEYARVQERMHEIAAEYLEAKNAPPLSKTVRQILELISSYDPDKQSPTTGIYVLGSARTLVEQVLAADAIVEEYEELEKRAVRQGELIKNQTLDPREDNTRAMREMTGKPIQ